MILDYTATKHPDGGVLITLDDTRFGGKAVRFPHTTVEQMAEGAAAYAGGKLIQQAYPFLTPSEREFLMTGMDDAEWAEIEAASRGAEAFDKGLTDATISSDEAFDLEEGIKALRASGMQVFVLETEEDFDNFLRAFDSDSSEEVAASLDAENEIDEEPDANACPGCGTQEEELGLDGLCPECHEEAVRMEAEEDGCPICGKLLCPGYCESGYGVR